MDKDNKRFDDLTDLSDLNQKYNHYLDDASSLQNDDNIENNAEKMQFEDVSSYSEGNADFYMQPREEQKTEVESSVEEPVKALPKTNGNFFSRNRYRNTKIIALVLVIVLLLGIGGFLLHIVTSTSGGNWDNSGYDYNTPDDDYLIEDDHNFEAMGDVNADSLNDFLYSWANNGGEKMYNKNVINVLLCGVDSETGDASSGRSDIMMLVSINKVTEKITMVSFLRDSWTYMRVPRKDGSTYDYYFKMNAAYNLGGPATLLETIENNFKIEIDEFIAVDFKSFPKLIDALGGVTVDVQEYEAKYIRRTSKQKNFPSGVSTLNGTQALIYSRIRKCDADSDISRTRRQRSVIKGLIDSAKSASNGQLLNAFKQVSGYLRTGYSQSEVFGLIAQAYTHKWMDFEMVELVLPSKDFIDRASTNINGQSTWVVDYALCAQQLQNALYGETNIVLADDRDSVLDLVTNRRETSTKNYNNDDTYSNDNSDENNNYYTNHSTSTTTSSITEDTTSSNDNYEESSTQEETSSKSNIFPSITLPTAGNDDENSENE